MSDIFTVDNIVDFVIMYAIVLFSWKVLGPFIANLIERRK